MTEKENVKKYSYINYVRYMSNFFKKSVLTTYKFLDI